MGNRSKYFHTLLHHITQEIVKIILKKIYIKEILDALEPFLTIKEFSLKEKKFHPIYINFA